MWQYDSDDWRGIGSETEVDNNYMNLITAAQNGTFSTVSNHQLLKYTALIFVDSLAQSCLLTN